jgi:hypothetical protein
MRVTTEDLVRAFKGNGDTFEEFVHDLVRAVGRSCGIDSIHVDWDYRTNVKDGGRDLVVKIANPRPDKQFIPARKSVWSLKSGDAGISPDSLKREIRNEKHPKLRISLQEGQAYIWCTIHPANQDQRDKMRKAADEVADELKVERSLIDFRWPEHLQGEVNLYPNLIPVHLPQIALVLANVLSLQQWSREPGMSEKWVEFGGRNDIVQRIGKHLLGRERPNVLHIAGLSGIGKTRTVFEACQRAPELNGVYYIEQFEQVDRALYRYLEEPDRYIVLVIDETPLDQIEAIIGRLGEFAERVRVVTIGPAVRQAPTTKSEIIVLPEPESETDVLAVARAAGTLLPDAVCQSIAVQSGHDLRLALLLVQASLRLPEFRGVPVINIDGVWQRLMGLFAQEIGNPAAFRSAYEVLTASIDVGMTEDVGEEIIALAKHFQHPVEHVRDAAATSSRCGLGIRTRRFFEASRRALAARLFAERVWPRIQDSLEDFFLTLPERLGRRFLERCHDCTQPVREEVMARVGNFFLKLLSGANITSLVSREASRLFQTWAEFDPARGLGWLRQAVERAAPDQLLGLDGEPDGSGGWRGRRQIVWLCEALVSFPDHFDDCEAVLFRLAQHETEPSIGNNSTAIWKNLFWPVLSGTPLPFSQRLSVLLRRLETATANELPLVLSAACDCIEHHFMGMLPVRRVVGGRVVPPAWTPKTHGELATLRQDAGHRILDAIGSLATDCLPMTLLVVINHLQTFTRLGLISRLRTLFRPDRLDEQVRRQLVGKLDAAISLLRERGSEQQPDPFLLSLEEWMEELSPHDLGTQARDLTAQPYWTVGDQEARNTRYERIADQLITDPKTFQELADWFASPQAQSAWQLGLKIGSQDKDGQLKGIVHDWLCVDRCRSTVVGYLSGTARREGGLPVEWANVLDNLIADHPEVAAIATTEADISIRGFERLVRLLDRLPPPVSRYLRSLAFGGWLRVLRSEHITRIVESLIPLTDAGDPEAVDVGVELLQAWTHLDQTIDQPIASVAMNLVRRALHFDRRQPAYNWQQVLLQLSPFYPDQVAELMVSRITSLRGPGSSADPDNVEVLIRAAAIDSATVMEAVGGALLDRERRTIFGIAVFNGLFEAIGLEQVAAWLERHGHEYLRWIARHFPSPYLDEHAQPVLPPLTEWLFHEHEGDNEAFSWFLMGRHTGSFHTQSDVDPGRKREEMQPFLRHHLRRVREWAEAEIRLAEQEAKYFQDLDEEDERR